VSVSTHSWIISKIDTQRKQVNLPSMLTYDVTVGVGLQATMRSGVKAITNLQLHAFVENLFKDELERTLRINPVEVSCNQTGASFQAVMALQDLKLKFNLVPRLKEISSLEEIKPYDRTHFYLIDRYTGHQTYHPSHHARLVKAGFIHAKNKKDEITPEGITFLQTHTQPLEYIEHLTSEETYGVLLQHWGVEDRSSRKHARWKHFGLLSESKNTVTVDLAGQTHPIIEITKIGMLAIASDIANLVKDFVKPIESHPKQKLLTDLHHFLVKQLTENQFGVLVSWVDPVVSNYYKSLLILQN